MLHQIKGLATTIQFPPGKSGDIHGIIAFHAIEAGAQKHADNHTHPVKVGVTDNLKKFVGEFIQRYQPAQSIQKYVFEHADQIAEDETGQTVGIGTQAGTYIGIQVNAENIGIHSSIFKSCIPFVTVTLILTRSHFLTVISLIEY